MRRKKHPVAYTLFESSNGMKINYFGKCSNSPYQCAVHTPILPGLRLKNRDC